LLEFCAIDKAAEAQVDRNNVKHAGLRERAGAAAHRRSGFLATTWSTVHHR
jgi:hypothetical protein